MTDNCLLRQNERRPNRTQSTTSQSTGNERSTIFVWLSIAALVLTLFLLRHFYFRETPLQKAITLVKAGKAARALPVLEQLSLQHPENASIKPWLAQAYLNCERIAEGRIALDTALRMGLPANEVNDAVKAYANFYEERADFEEAEKLFQSANSICSQQMLNESRANLYFDWAENDLDENNVAQAIDHLEEAKKLSSFIKEPLRSKIPRRLAEAYRRMAALSEASGDYQEAADFLEKSLLVYDQAATRMSLAQIYIQLDKINKAIENYQIIADSDQDNLEARHRVIDLLIQLNRYADAQEALVSLTDKEKVLKIINN